MKKFLLAFALISISLVDVNAQVIRIYKGDSVVATYTQAQADRVVFDDGQPISDGANQYVDLGLSVKWATCNLGATSPEEYGNYYAWGEVVPQYSEAYTWESYKFSVGHAGYPQFQLLKYTTPDGATYASWYEDDVFIGDNISTLDPEDDAATANWGADWRMPTVEEMKELVDNCLWLETSDYKDTGVPGYIVYRAKQDSDKGLLFPENYYEIPNYSLTDNHIFLPTTGYSLQIGFFYGTPGIYSTSSVVEADCTKAHCLCVGSGQLSYLSSIERCIGAPVRAVHP